MPSHDFEFHLKVDAGGGATGLADAVAVEVLRHLGCGTEAAAGFARSLHAALMEVCDGAQACDVRFRAVADSLEAVVSAGSKTSRRIVGPIPIK